MLRIGAVELTTQKVILLAIREIYLFFSHLLGLILHPYKTLRTISREKDLSQAILLSSWPLPLWFVLGGLFLVINFLFRPGGIFTTLVKTFNLFFILYSLFIILYSAYLAYWLIFYLKARRRSQP